MKRFVVVLSIIVVFTLSLNFLYAIAQDVHHQDVYYHLPFDHHGNLTSTGNEEVLYATDEEATHRSFYIVYNVTDANGDEHQLWVSGVYSRKKENGQWERLGGWELSDEEIRAFFEEHTDYYD